MHRTALLAALALPRAAAGQERAPGQVSLDQPAPAPQGAETVLEQETPAGTTLTLQNEVLFDFDKAALKPGAAAALGRVAEILRQRRPGRVLVLAHTDSVGADAVNDQLSLQRAEAVRAWLADHGGGGLPPSWVEGKGERDPAAPNSIAGRDNPEGRQRNRRVEVLLER